VILLLAGIGLLLAAAAGSVLFRRRPWGETFTTGGIAAALLAIAVPALGVLLSGNSLQLRWAAGVPGGDWILGLDPLSALFLLTILVPGLASAWFGNHYLAPERAHRAVWLHHAGFAAVLAALALVATARSVLLFLGAWELMALGAYALIVTEHEQAAVRRSGLLYLVTTHTATLALVAMFALWTRPGGDWTFTVLATVGAQGEPGLRTAVFALALIGFGIKAGLVPFHFWLPPAHAAAPSNVSALLSAVVIKAGIYGLLRVIALLGPPPVWWSWTVLTVGALSAVLGVLWALVQHDIKRLLAYHSVENIGIILLGIGVGGLGAAGGVPAVALLGYAAAALHTLNHALFKSALFLAAGSVSRATGTRNLEQLGGLGRRMPRTWLGFLLAAAAIVGLPPLNGFVSEWLVFQGLLRAGQAPGGLRLAVFAIPVLALVGGLALACFAKVAGIVFLGTPRSEAAANAREPGPGLTRPVLALGVACLLIGMLPALLIRPLFNVAGVIAGLDPADVGRTAGAVLPDAQRLSLLAVALLLAAGGFALLRRLALRGRSIRSAETWGCGYPLPTPRMQYTASSFAAPLAGVFGGLAGVREHRGATVFHSHPVDLLLDGVMQPAWHRIQRLALRLRPMQQGRLHAYLLYVVITVVLLLLYLVLFPAR
jgi:formate hydrogenlyase subunit 3/multisubunit Na+/H+ antiporter MnhD subunit